MYDQEREHEALSHVSETEEAQRAIRCPSELAFQTFQLAQRKDYLVWVTDLDEATSTTTPEVVLEHLPIAGVDVDAEETSPASL